MLVSNNFKPYQYPISLSKEGYIDKKISGAMIGTTKNEENRKIRKEYGYASNKGIGFQETIVTPETHLKFMTEGRVFCHLFNPGRTRTDNTFGSNEKKDCNFLGSYVIGVDIDHTDYNSAEEYISKLSIEPTFYYTSYSNMQKNEDGSSKGARFRLIYVFDEKIEDPYKFRYCAYQLNRIIEKDTDELITDDCNLRCSQYFNGTNENNPNLVIEKGCSGKIYSTRDINVSSEGYIDFLINFAYYKTKSKERKQAIKEKLNELTGNNYIWDKVTETYLLVPPTQPTTVTTDGNDTETTIEALDPNLPTVRDYNEISERIFNDWDRLCEESFKKTADWEYARSNNPYIYRVENEYWYNDSYQLAGEDYFKLYFYQERLKDGQQRRKSLYQRICLRRIIKPEITKDQMLVNVLIDVMKFFDNTDFALNSEFIRTNINSAFDTEISELEKELKDQIEWLKKNTRPKRGIIYKNKESHSLELTYNILDDLYNKLLSVEENLDLINNTYGFIISQRHIYRYLQNRGIKAVKKGSSSDSQIKALIDLNLSSRKNLEILKANGIKGNLGKVQRLMKEKQVEVEEMLSGASFFKNQSMNDTDTDQTISETEERQIETDLTKEYNVTTTDNDPIEINDYSNTFGNFGDQWLKDLEEKKEKAQRNDPILASLETIPDTDLEPDYDFSDYNFENTATFIPFDEIGRGDFRSYQSEKKIAKLEPEEEIEYRSGFSFSTPTLSLPDPIENNDPEEEYKEPIKETDSKEENMMFNFSVPKFGFGF